MAAIIRPNIAFTLSVDPRIKYFFDYPSIKERMPPLNVLSGITHALDDKEDNHSCEDDENYRHQPRHT